MNEPEETLDPQLADAFSQLKAVPPRRAVAAARGRAQFLAEAQVAPLRRSSWMPSAWLTPFTRRTSFAMATAVILFFGLIVGGTGAAAYAAEDSLPDSPLYPVKLFTEDARLSLAFQPDAKLDLILAFADRRMSEMAAMGKGKAPPPEAVAYHLEQELDDALEMVMGLPDAARDQALAKMQARIERQTQKAIEMQSRITNHGQAVVTRVNKALRDRLELVEMGKADPPGLKKKMQEPKREIAPTPTLEKEQRPGSPPGQEPKASPESKDSPGNKGNENKGNGNGNGKH